VKNHPVSSSSEAGQHRPRPPTRARCRVEELEGPAHDPLQPQPRRRADPGRSNPDDRRRL